MRSSYIKNNYADVFKAVIRGFNPRNCVELGVLDGYSTLAIAEGLSPIGGHLDAYDLFDQYEFKHGNKAAIQQEIDKRNLHDVVTLIQADAFKVHVNYTPASIGLLHVDLSNTGEVLRRIMELWDEKIVQGGVILFEGGSEERDQEAWMIKYGKEPIKPELERNKIIEEKYVFGTYLKWPSLTCLLKKRY